MLYHKLNRIGQCDIKPADFPFSPIFSQDSTFSQLRTLHERAHAIHAKLIDKESFVTKSPL